MGLDDDARRWLLQTLREIVHAHGSEPLLERPILEPTEQYFAPWEPTEAALVALVQRMFRYAGIEDMRVDIIERAPLPERHVKTPQMVRAAVGFTVLEAGDGPVRLEQLGPDDCGLLVDPDQLDQPLAVLGAVCRVVALAFRSSLAFSSYRESSAPWTRPTTDEERRKVDATAVYLGFGVLTANDAYTLRQTTKTITHRRAGRLGEESMSFLLAAQARARGMSRPDRHDLVKLLEPNQAGYFQDWFDFLEDQRVNVLGD